MRPYLCKDHFLEAHVKKCQYKDETEQNICRWHCHKSSAGSSMMSLPN